MGFVDTKVLTLKVEQCWRAGTKLRFKGEGNQMHPNTTGDSHPGDIIFTVVEEPHPRFERIADSSDIRYVHKCSLLEALSGHCITLELLDGSIMNQYISEQVNPG